MAAVARFFIFVLLIMPATVGDARAQPNVVQQVTEWGLLGTWSSDCRRTPLTPDISSATAMCCNTGGTTRTPHP